MPSNLIVILFDPASPGPPGVDENTDMASRLETCGFLVNHCADPRWLPDFITHAGVGACLILNGAPDQNCLAASSVRMRHPDLVIVVMVPSDGEDALIQALRSGADACCPQGASAALLATLLSTVFRRIRQSAGRWPFRGWSLQERDWVLVGPDDCRVSLTTGERAFLRALLHAPGSRASHGDLAAAVNAAYGAEAPQRVRQIGLLVSRMRRKFEDRGVALPLRSVHGWGYMFTQGASDQR
ncbi:MAG TPA: helix-turn-helix domain-containing protein [Burkholderiaceae bacterium]|nr:helix-turn-helix domain-containing protein [Burkholderiaceae bacterium]